MEKNIVRTLITIIVLLALICTAAMAESCPTQPPATGWVTLHWIEAELYKSGIDDFELKLESTLTPAKNYVLELIVSFPIEEGHTRKVFAQIKDGELMVREGYILLPKEIGEDVLSTIKNIV